MHLAGFVRGAWGRRSPPSVDRLAGNGREVSVQMCVPLSGTGREIGRRGWKVSGSAVHSRPEWSIGRMCATFLTCLPVIFDT